MPSVGQGVDKVLALFPARRFSRPPQNRGVASPANTRGREMKGWGHPWLLFSFMWARHHKMPRDLDIRQRGERASGPTRALP